MPVDGGHLVEALVRPEQGQPYGMFRFASLPRSGDQISIGNPAGGNDVLEVLYISHNPAPVPVRTFARQEPTATVIVRFLREYGGTL